MKLLYGIVVVLCVFGSEVAAQTSHAGKGYYIYYNSREKVPTSINFDSLPFFGKPADITYTETSGQFPSQVSIRETGGIGRFDTDYQTRFSPGYDTEGTTVLKYDSDSLIFITHWNDSLQVEDKTVPNSDPNHWYTIYQSFFAEAWIPLGTSSVAPEPTAAPVRFFPNPASEVLNVLTPATSAARITIYDQLGKAVLSASLETAGKTIDISKLTSATYTLVYEAAGKQTSERFIKY